MCEHTCLPWVFTFVLPSVTPRLLPGLPHCLSPETPLPSRLLRVVASLPLFLLSKPRRPEASEACRAFSQVSREFIRKVNP
jgi:hypothetical protein